MEYTVSIKENEQMNHPVTLFGALHKAEKG